MQKRTLAILLIIFALLAIAGVLYWTFLPTLKSRKNPDVVRPSVQNNPTPLAQAPAVAQPLPSKPSPVSVPPTKEAVSEEQAQQVLRQQAMAFASRQGSYTNTDAFVALRDVYPDVTPTVLAFFQSEQVRLSQEHPIKTGSWTQTTRALSSRISSPLPLIGKNAASVVVQAQQIIDTPEKPGEISYVEINVSFLRTSEGRWFVSRVDSKPLSL